MSKVIRSGPLPGHLIDPLHPFMDSWLEQEGFDQQSEHGLPMLVLDDLPVLIPRRRPERANCGGNLVCEA